MDIEKRIELRKIDIELMCKIIREDSERFILDPSVKVPYLSYQRLEEANYQIIDIKTKAVFIISEDDDVLLKRGDNFHSFISDIDEEYAVWSSFRFILPMICYRRNNKFLEETLSDFLI